LRTGIVRSLRLDTEKGGAYAYFIALYRNYSRNDIMIPLRDTIRSKNYPVVNITLIVVNVLAGIIELGHLRELDAFIFTYGLVPARYTIPELGMHFSFGEQALALLSFMFLHGGFWHLLGNMWFLYIFGDNVEDTLGPLRYLVFYLLCGWVSGLTHLFFNFYSQVPTIGASGAVAGVMGAYFITYPRSKILTLIPIIIIPFFVEIPAAVFLGIWFLFQFLSASLADAHASTIAWWAHIGGFAVGMVFLKVFQLFPQTGAVSKIRQKTVKGRSPRLRVIKTTGRGDHFYGTMVITEKEALTGTKKTISIPHGFKKMLFTVTIPPGISNGQTVRLAGIAGHLGDKTFGDAFLKVVVE